MAKCALFKKTFQVSCGFEQGYLINSGFSLEHFNDVEDYNLNEPPPPGKSTTLQERLGEINLFGSLIQNTENFIGRVDKSALGKMRFVYVNDKGIWRYVKIKLGQYDPYNGYFPDPYYFQNAGYRYKNYQFDQRLLNAFPPYIMAPEKGGWVIVSWKKLPPDYSVK